MFYTLSEDFDFYGVIEDEEEFLDSDWEVLKEDGFLWRDKYGKPYKPTEISTQYLERILKFCERVYRPCEQVKALKEELQCRTNQKK